MTKGIKRQLTTARQAANNEIDQLRGDGMYGRGLSSEGYMGGYRDALDDVLLALNGVEPQRWYDWRRTNEHKT